MNSQHQSKAPKRSKKPQGFLLKAIIILILLAGSFVFLREWRSQQPTPQDAESPQAPVAEKSIAEPITTQKTEEETLSPALADLPEADQEMQAAGQEGISLLPDGTVVSPPSALPGAQQEQKSLTGKQSGMGQGISSCGQATDQIASFYTHLDHQPYMQAYQLNEASSVYFPALIKRLLDNPPVVSRETDDLFTILKNTAHFFRVLGKDNVLILKGILDREKKSVEDILASYHLLLSNEQCAAANGYKDLPRQALYDYAGFFLNTMGGRLYLFRRDSLSRMVVNFYSIITVEQANLERTNNYGIELRQAVDMLIAEMETTGNRLKYRNRYLDKLYDLKEKYSTGNQ